MHLFGDIEEDIGSVNCELEVFLGVDFGLFEGLAELRILLL
jgi:hypothetical protein